MWETDVTSWTWGGTTTSGGKCPETTVEGLLCFKCIFFSALSSSESIVDEECILELFQWCRTCQRRCRFRKRVTGLKLEVTQKCRFCQSCWRWTNLPELGEDCLQKLNWIRCPAHQNMAGVRANAANVQTQTCYTPIFNCKSWCIFQTILFEVLVEDYKTATRELRKRIKSDYRCPLVTPRFKISLKINSGTVKTKTCCILKSQSMCYIKTHLLF